MKKRIVITDLTRMQHGNVCICGYDKDHNCVRPIFSSLGISEKSLIQDGKPIIFPFALVEFDFVSPRPQPPHTEDTIFFSGSPQFIQQVSDRQKILIWSLFDDVENLFEQPVLTDVGFSVMDCQGPRSVGTIEPKIIHKIIYEAGPDGVWDFRMAFDDNSDTYFRLKITDLTWHYYCNSFRGTGRDADSIAKEMTNVLKDKTVLIRIGLSRGWAKFPDRCFLQVNGIYTFPDYLDGKIFIDFYEHANLS